MNINPETEADTVENLRARVSVLTVGLAVSGACNFLLLVLKLLGKS